MGTEDEPTPEKRMCPCWEVARSEVLRNKAELQRSSIPIDHGHGTDFGTTSGAAGAQGALARAPNRPLSFLRPDHTEDHVALGDGAGRWETTHRKDYVRKDGDGYEKVRPDVDPYATHIPGARHPDDGGRWAAENLVSEHRKGFVKHPHAARAAQDPKLQGSHFSLGSGRGTDYRTTSETMLVAHPLEGRDGPRLTKEQLQRSSVPRGDVAAWKQDLMSSSAASFKGADPAAVARARAGTELGDFHRACHIDVAGTGKTGTYATTNQSDYTDKHGPSFQRARPTIDPHASSVRTGDIPDEQWRREQLVSLHRESFVARPDARRSAKDPKLQGTHFRLGADKASYATTTGEFFGAPPVAGEAGRAKATKVDLQRTSIVHGDDGDAAERFRTTTKDAFVALADGKRDRVANDFHGETNFNVTGGKSDEGTWVTTNRHDYVPKETDASKVDPKVNPYVSSLPPPPVPDAEWRKEQLVSSNRENFHSHPEARRSTKNPELQKSHIQIGRGATDWTTSNQAANAAVMLCPCPSDDED